MKNYTLFLNDTVYCNIGDKVMDGVISIKFLLSTPCCFIRSHLSLLFCFESSVEMCGGV